jgi:acyl carrier protein
VVELEEDFKIISMESNLNKEFYKFLKEEFNININENSPNFGLERDLNIYGEDAFEFIEKFAKRFNINLDNFNFEKYFNPEIDRISLLFKNKFRNNNKSELTIQDLKSAIINGKLE